MTIRLVVEGLGARRGEALIFRNLSFSLGPGEALLVTGRNGSGKSTMLAALTESDGAATGAVGLVIWAVLAILGSVLAVTRHRSTSARAVLTQPA